MNVPAPIDSRCSDPAFSLANPDICPTTPHLVIKPGVALVCFLGGVQFTAVLVTNGVEQDVSTNCLWATSNPNLALIGASSGNATGLAQGDVTISATYQTYTATAELSVMASSGSSCCSSQRVAMMLVVDTSLSMSQQFGSNYYSTRLDFAKAAASRFASEVNI
ncbi:MAG TPA: VWA domain-containing protein, partial [Terracidiphilus sp.]|nr:VWA domain-containing protein [Terracidiphilus sp.]